MKQKVCDEPGCVEIILYSKGRTPSRCESCRKERKKKQNKKWYKKNSHKWIEYKQKQRDNGNYLKLKNKKLQNKKNLDQYIEAVVGQIDFIEEYREDNKYWSEFSVDNDD